MSFEISFVSYNDMFAVPKALADRYLKLCSENQLKVLLLALRESPDAAAIAKRLGISEAEVEDCMEFWADAGLMRPSGDEKSAAEPAKSLAPAVPCAPAATVETAPTGQTVTTVHSRSRLTPAQINSISQSDPRLPALVQELQRILGSALSPGETETVAYMYSALGLTPEYILLAAKYCHSIQKGRVRYIEKTIAGWLEKGLDSYASAEGEVERLQKAAGSEYIIRSMFGLGQRDLSAREREFIDLWFNVYKTPGELIALAYDRTVDNTGKASFPYLNKILAKWHEKGIATVEAAMADLSGKPSAKTGNGVYSTDEVERLMEKRLFGE